jgi:pimeloyl-ACP methyl ester carboxylesterase
VLVHGNYWKDSLGTIGDPADRMFLLEPLRRDPRYAEVLGRYRVFLFQYGTHEDYQKSGAALAGRIRDVLDEARPPDRDLTIVAHSLGGLVARYAIQEPDIGPRLRDLVTLGTPHRGTPLVNYLMANPRVRAQIGLFGLFCQRMSRRIWPVNDGIRGMAYDNWDGLLPEDMVREFGLYMHPPLAELNRSDPYTDRITCVMGRVEGMWLRGRNLFDQVPRWLIGHLYPILRGLDPLVHLESGLADGLAVRARHALEGLDHEGIVTHPRSRDLVFRLLLA